MSDKYYLDKDWEFKIGDSYSSKKPKEIATKKWFAAEIPGTVHTDLLKNKMIEEPFYSNNELKMDWIAESDWIYKTVFEFPFEKDGRVVKLNFDGIDTVAKIYLNGIQLGVTNNMFLKYEFDVTKYLNQKNNELKLFFESPINYCLRLERQHGKLRVALNSSRVYIRKAQYSFGWDWGPTFPAIGIWRNVYLEIEKKALVKNISFDTIDIKNNVAEVEVRFDVENKSKEPMLVDLNLSCIDSHFNKIVEVTEGRNIVEFVVKNPMLWMPNGYGGQNLYDLEIKLKTKSEHVIDPVKKKVGIRTVELKLKEGEENTFHFVVNGHKIYAKGVNWIPGDAFLPRVKEDKYRALLSFAKDANMNIIRVWGGGIYENDIFYDLCDELGLLVWQDFMFACGSYPEYNEFVQNVREEILYNVNRIKHHPSIAIWCGNNENEWGWFQENKSSYQIMPGYKIYSDIIPSLLKEIDPLRPYWQSSPFGLDNDPNSQTSGNRHQWDIWSNWIDYNTVVNDNSLFVTEFGFQGPANKSTFAKYIPKADRKIHGEIFEFHNKQVEGSERVTRFLSAHLPLSTDWDDYLYLAQLNQGFALKTCLEHWRFNQPRTNGSIIWQINDTWPVTSWALIDSELKPKLSYYFVKNAFAPQTIRMVPNNNVIEIEGLNESDKIFNGKIELIVMESSSGKSLLKKSIAVKISGNSISRLMTINRKFDHDSIVIATLLDERKNVVSRNYCCAKEWKYLTLPKVKVTIKLLKKDNIQMAKIKTDKAAFFVDLISEFGKLSDRGIIILPGETVLVNIISDKNRFIKREEIELYSLNQYLCD